MLSSPFLKFRLKLTAHSLLHGLNSHFPFQNIRYNVKHSYIHTSAREIISAKNGYPFPYFHIDLQ